MIKTELYFDFRIINRDDYSEQIKFYEKYVHILENRNSYDNLGSRNEFIRRIFIIYCCAVAYNNSNNFRKAISIFDLVIELIEDKKIIFNFDLKRDHYYIDSLFEKGKAQYYLKKYAEAGKTFDLIMNTGFANYFHANWYVFSKNKKLYEHLNNAILILVVFIMIFPKIAFSLSPPTTIYLDIVGIAFLLLAFFNPSKRISDYKTKKYIEKFSQNLENRLDSIEYYSQKIQKNPNDFVSLMERGILYNLKDEFEKSLDDLNKILSVNPNNKEALYYRAIDLTELNRTEEAIKDLTKQIELGDTNLAEIYNNRGFAYMLLQKFELALHDYNKAIELEPFHAFYLFNRAFLYQENGKNKEAILDYDKVIKLEPENYTAITNRGEAHYALGNKEQAFADFNRAKDFDYQEATDNLEKLEF